MIQMQDHAQQGAQGQQRVWRGREGNQGRCSLRSSCGNPGDVGLMNCGKNWPFIK